MHPKWLKRKTLFMNVLKTISALAFSIFLTKIKNYFTLVQGHTSGPLHKCRVILQDLYDIRNVNISNRSVKSLMTVVCNVPP
jgi:hypothetical protein